MKPIKTYTFILAIIFAFTCEMGAANYDFQKGTDFSVYQTYAWQQKMVDIFEGRVTTNVRNPLNLKRIRSAIESELAAKGIELVDRAQADIHVVFHGLLEERIDIDDWGYGIGYGRGAYYGRGYYGSSIEVDQYTEGTLFIDIVDAKTNELVWRGWVKRRVTDNIKESMINKAVAQVFKKYPPKEK